MQVAQWKQNVHLSREFGVSVNKQYLKVADLPESKALVLSHLAM